MTAFGFRRKFYRKSIIRKISRVKNGLLLLVTLIIVWEAHSQGLLYFNNPEWICENNIGSGNLCTSGCNDTKLLIGEPFNCSAPGHECCDQFESAYCNHEDVCSCRPGFEPFVLQHFNRFPVICLLSAGEPCRASHGYTQFKPEEYNFIMNTPSFVNYDHNKTYHILQKLLYEIIGTDKIRRDKMHFHMYLIGLIVRAKERLKLEEYPNMVDWGCASGKCIDATHTCAEGVNPFFEYFRRPIPKGAYVAPMFYKRSPGGGTNHSSDPDLDLSMHKEELLIYSGQDTTQPSLQTVMATMFVLTLTFLFNVC